MKIEERQKVYSITLYNLISRISWKSATIIEKRPKNGDYSNPERIPTGKYRLRLFMSQTVVKSFSVLHGQVNSTMANNLISAGVSKSVCKSRKRCLKSKSQFMFGQFAITQHCAESFFLSIHSITTFFLIVFDSFQSV